MKQLAYIDFEFPTHFGFQFEEILFISCIIHVLIALGCWIICTPMGKTLHLMAGLNLLFSFLLLAAAVWIANDPTNPHKRAKALTVYDITALLMKFEIFLIFPFMIYKAATAEEPKTEHERFKSTWPEQFSD